MPRGRYGEENRLMAEWKLALGSKDGSRRKSTKKLALRRLNKLAACDSLIYSREPEWRFRLDLGVPG
jgi:hypothetical protein